MHAVAMASPSQMVPRSSYPVGEITVHEILDEDR
jgi:hypothetical protein